MPKSIKEITDERAKLIADNRALLNGAKDGKLSPEQRHEWEKRDADIDRLSAERDELLDAGRLKERADRYDEMLKEEPRRVTAAKSPSGEREDGTGYKTISVGRHSLTVPAAHPLAKRLAPEYEEEFGKYLAHGAVGQQLGMVTSKDDKGGYAAPTAMTSRLIKFVDDNVFMRQIATVLPPIPEAVSLGAVSYDSDAGDADWTAEVPASDIAEDDGTTLGKRELRPHLLTKLIKMSEKFLRTAAMLPGGPTNFISDRLGYKFGVTEEKAFMTGDGNQKPLGVFVASNDGVPTSRDYTCAAVDDFTADDVLNGLYALKVQYQERAWGLFSREFVRRLRLKKTGDGQYLWQPGLVAGQPDRVVGRPYKQSEFVPTTYTTGQYVGMWADFSWYWIQDAMGLTIQRLMELFQLRNQVGLLARKETDGMPVLAEAFSRLKLK